MMKNFEGLIYPVTLANRSQTWDTAYRDALEECIEAYRAKAGEPTHVQLPRCVDPTTLSLNGLQVMPQLIGRGSLALWGTKEIEQPEPTPANNGHEGVYICRNPICRAESIDPGAAECWACGFDGRKE